MKARAQVSGSPDNALSSAVMQPYRRPLAFSTAECSSRSAVLHDTVFGSYSEIGFSDRPPIVTDTFRKGFREVNHRYKDRVSCAD